MLQNASLLAIVAVDTEENEPMKNEVWWVRRHFGGPRQNYYESSAEGSDDESDYESDDEQAQDITNGEPLPRKFPEWAVKHIEVLI